MEMSLLLAELPLLRAVQDGKTSWEGITVADGAPPPSFIVDGSIGALERGDSAEWDSFYFFVLSDEHLAVGSGGFKGPSKNGRVEIGYGVAPNQQGKGYASAAVRLLVDRALGNAEVEEVFAETAVLNLASRRVVEKCGFGHVGQRDTEEDGIVDQWLVRRPNPHGALDGGEKVAV